MGEFAIDRRFDRMPQKVGDEQYDDSAQHDVPGKASKPAGGGGKARDGGSERQGENEGFRGPGKGPEDQGQGAQVRRARLRHPQGSITQKQSPAEVDETTLNPLITRIQVERSNDTGPRGTGRVSRYRLQSSGMIAGRFERAGNRSG